jgi:hypothetical protein
MTSYLSYRIKNLRLFLLICDGDVAQNLEQLRILVLLCLEGRSASTEEVEALAQLFFGWGVAD